MTIWMSHFRDVWYASSDQCVACATKENEQTANHEVLFDMREHLARKTTSLFIRNNRNTFQVTLPGNLGVCNLDAVVCVNVKRNACFTTLLLM